MKFHKPVFFQLVRLRKNALCRIPAAPPRKLVKVRAVGRNRDELMRIAEIFRARIVDVTEKTFTIEVTGTTEKNTAFLKAIDHSLILETVRTGAGGIARGERMIRL